MMSNWPVFVARLSYLRLLAQHLLLGTFAALELVRLQDKVRGNVTITPFQLEATLYLLSVASILLLAILEAALSIDRSCEMSRDACMSLRYLGVPLSSCRASNTAPS